MISPKWKARQSFTQVDKITLLVLLSSYSHPSTLRLWYRGDLSRQDYYTPDSLTAMDTYLCLLLTRQHAEGSPDLDKDQFYNQLSSVVQSISLHDELILLGDFNAVTGPRAQDFENVVGHFGFGTPNDNSARPLSVCSSHRHSRVVVPAT